MDALKIGLSLPVLLVDASATGTGAGCIVGIDDDQRNTTQDGFVGKKLPQLIKGPRMVFAPLGSSDFHRFSNPGQILNGDPFSLRNRFFHNAFCNGVVDDCRKPPFPSTEPFQELSAPPCAFGLNGTAGSLVLLSNGIQRVGRKICPVRECGDVVDSEIHPDKVFHIFNIGIRNFDRLKQIKLSFPCDKIRFSLDVRKIFGVMTSERNSETTSDRPNGGLRALVGKNSTVIGNGSQWPEYVKSLFVRFIGLGDFSETSDEHLGRQNVLSLESVIKSLVQLEVIEYFLFKGKLRDSMTGKIRLFDRFEKNVGLFFRRKKFDLQCQLHKNIYTSII